MLFTEGDISSEMYGKYFFKQLASKNSIIIGKGKERVKQLRLACVILLLSTVGHITRTLPVRILSGKTGSSRRL